VDNESAGVIAGMSKVKNLPYIGCSRSVFRLEVVQLNDIACALETHRASRCSSHTFYDPLRTSMIFSLNVIMGSIFIQPKTGSSRSQARGNVTTHFGFCIP
jgi:hypothetical protein